MSGSYLYYCTEMGMPFSIYGKKAVIINRTDSNFPEGLMPGDPNRQVYTLFSGLFTKITPAQKEYVETHLGLKDCLSRKEMAWILYSSFLRKKLNRFSN